MVDQQLMERCIEECLECVKLASHCADFCLEAEQVNAMVRCIRLCLDCTNLGAACAEMMGRDSQFSVQLCGVMADVCDACAEECEKHQGDISEKYESDVTRRCAEACRRCAETCRQVLQAAAA